MAVSSKSGRRLGSSNGDYVVIRKINWALYRARLFHNTPVRYWMPDEPIPILDWVSKSDRSKIGWVGYGGNFVETLVQMGRNPWKERKEFHG